MGRRPRARWLPRRGGLLWASGVQLAAGRGDEGPEQPRVVAGLGMPLHGEREPGPAGVAAVRPGPGELDRLDHPVGGPRAGGQALAETFDGLMVVGGNGKPVAGPRVAEHPASLLPGATRTG